MITTTNIKMYIDPWGTKFSAKDLKPSQCMGCSLTVNSLLPKGSKRKVCTKCKASTCSSGDL